MESLIAWLFLSVIVERIVEVLVKLVPAIGEIRIKQFDIKMLIAFVFGAVFVFGADLDFFRMVNIEFTLPYVGYVVSSIFVMAGSGYISDIIAQLGRVKEQQVIVVEVEKD
jgi:hypothetical protein